MRGGNENKNKLIIFMLLKIWFLFVLSIKVIVIKIFNNIIEFVIMYGIFFLVFGFVLEI